MKKFASTRSLNKILQQCDSSSREYEEIQAVEKKWHLHLATPRKFLDKKSKMPSLFLSAPPPPKRAPSTTLTLRSKSMTAELEELGKGRGAGARCTGSMRGRGQAGGAHRVRCAEGSVGRSRRAAPALNFLLCLAARGAGGEIPVPPPQRVGAPAEPVPPVPPP